MLLMPKRVKHRKSPPRPPQGHGHRGNAIAFGEFGLQALETGWIDSSQIEAARRAITHHVRRGGKVWIRVFPDKPVTQKPAETRMGSGQGRARITGSPSSSRGASCSRSPGCREDMAKEALRLAGYKLPIPTKVIVQAMCRSAVTEEAEGEARATRE